MLVSSSWVNQSSSRSLKLWRSVLAYGPITSWPLGQPLPLYLEISQITWYHSHPSPGSNPRISLLLHFTSPPRDLAVSDFPRLQDHRKSSSPSKIHHTAAFLPISLLLPFQIAATAIPISTNSWIWHIPTSPSLHLLSSQHHVDLPAPHRPLPTPRRPLPTPFPTRMTRCWPSMTF